jgi:hypothetical protein
MERAESGPRPLDLFQPFAAEASAVANSIQRLEPTLRELKIARRIATTDRRRVELLTT